MSGVATHFIFYVAEQGRSAAFYRRVLAREPRLDVPGMTEFELPGGAVLGLMPEAGIRRLLGPALTDPATAQGVPRAELYLRLTPGGGDSGAAAMLDRALAAGAREWSPLLRRNWGDKAAYVSDPDGHVLAFAEADAADADSSAHPIVVRSATAADATAIAALATQVFLDTYATAGVRPDLAREAFAEYSVGRFVTRMAQDTRRFIVAERIEPDGGQLGFAEVELSSSAASAGGARGSELVRLYVQPRQQRSGIGHRLLAAAERTAAEARLPLLWLTAWEGNVRALAFYAKHGYADVGSADYRFEGRSYVNRVLTKSLHAAGSGADPVGERIAQIGGWRGATLQHIRALIRRAVPGVVEELKWGATPVWSHHGIICTGESYQKVVKMTFAKGASLPDPAHLFNSSLDGKVRRAIDVREGEPVDEAALQALFRAAAELNSSQPRR